MSVPAVAIADGDSACHVQGREQRRHAMAFVIMRLARRYAWRKRQNRLRTVERLNLALFIHTQDNCAIRRIQVQPDNVSYLLDELRVLENLRF